MRRLLLVGLAVLLLAGGWWLWQRGQDERLTGDGSLIAAPPGPYKVRPDEAGGMTVEGQGSAAFAASEGAEAGGTIDFGAAPEDPVQTQRAGQAGGARDGHGSRSVTATLPGVEGTLAERGGREAERTASASSGQAELGRYGSEAAANGAWNGLVKRLPWLDGLPRGVAVLEADGRKVYALRVGSAAQGRAICARLRVAGEPCQLGG